MNKEGKKSVIIDLEKEFKSISFNLFILSAVILIISFEFGSLLMKNIFLGIYLLTIIYYNFSNHRFREQDYFGKAGSLLTIFVTLIFLIILSFLQINNLYIDIFGIKFGLFLLFFTFTVLSFSYFRRSREMNPLILTYVMLSIDVIILFGYLFAILSSIPGNGLYDINNNFITSIEDNIYFSSVTFYSLGYGDIYPVGGWVRLLSQIEVALGVLIHVVGFGTLVTNKKQEDRK